MPRQTRNTEARRLTPRQLRILTFIRDYRQNHGYSPTMQELADALGVTKVTIFEHVAALERKGLLRKLPHKARSLELTSLVRFPESGAVEVPLVGHIAAGAAIEAVEQTETIALDQLLPVRDGTFLLRVRGDSMIDEQIRDGDYVLIERREQVQDGETVVALLDGGEATLKKFYRERRRIRLEPANPAFEPIYVTPDRLDIQGVVVGVFRAY